MAAKIGEIPKNVNILKNECGFGDKIGISGIPAAVQVASTAASHSADILLNPG